MKRCRMLRFTGNPSGRTDQHRGPATNSQGDNVDQFDADQLGTMDQIDALVTSLQTLDVTDEGREALVSTEAHTTGGLI